MENFEEQIQKFEQDYEDIIQKHYKEFPVLENDFCTLINEGTKLRNYLKENPQLCDENTYRVVSNQLHDMSLIEDKYKFLKHVLELKKILLDQYQKYLKFLMDNHKYNEAINIYNQMFAFTGNYFYKKEIANIELKIFGKYDKCLNTYKEIQPHMENVAHFWWEFSEVYSDGKDYYNQILCIQRAVKLEMEKMNK